MRARVPLVGLVLTLVALLGAAQPAAAQRPNIVFVLTDDLSSNLVPYMPQVLALQQQGTTFSRYVVTDSLCCPSRASIFTGRYPHSTGVLKNMGADGGFGAFHPVEEKSTFATALQRIGYRTALMGKYLNGYFPFATVDGAQALRPARLVGVGGRRRRLSGVQLQPRRQGDGDPARLVHFGGAPEDYLTDVIARQGHDFIDRAVQQRQAVPARALDLRAARPLHARPARRRPLPRARRRHATHCSTRPSWTRGRPGCHPSRCHRSRSPASTATSASACSPSRPSTA